MVDDDEEDTAVDVSEFDLNQLHETGPDLAPENLDTYGLVDFDREVATNESWPLLTKLLTNTSHNLLKSLKMAAVTRMRFPTNQYHNYHEMKLTRQSKFWID